MEFDIPEDAYGAAILALVKDLTDLFNEELVSPLTITKLAFPMVILAANLALQFSCLVYIERYVVAPSVHHVQETYYRFHKRVFDTNGQFIPENWNNEAYYSHDEKSNLCQIAMTNQVFYYTILVLWTLSSMHEIRTGQRLCANILRVPRAETLGDQLQDHEDEEKMSIKALKPAVRGLMICVVVLPKIVISCCLMGLGMRWLSATTSFEELVMNAVAMTFVTQIDELLYHFALPAGYRHLVSEINFSLDITQADLDRENWIAYIRSAFYCLLSIVIVWIYAEMVQDVLPNKVYELVDKCRDWQRTNTMIRCPTSLWQKLQTGFTRGLIQAMTTPEYCYPFGAEETNMTDNE